jgi:pullulanase/glycogen debranching enzyme
MFYMGDEYGHTKGGNNNTYCHDHHVSSMWPYSFVTKLITWHLTFCNVCFYVGQLFPLG